MERKKKIQKEKEIFLSETKKLEKILRGRKKPGPSGSDTLIAPERDLRDASLILQLIERGRLKTDSHPTFQGTKRDNYGRLVNRLNAEEENTLALRVQKYGDIDARNSLVMANMGLVYLVANQFSRPPLRYEDLVQEGIMGLIRATESFEPNKGVRFSTYSVYWIKAKIQRLLQKLDKDDSPCINGAAALLDENGKKRKAKARKISIDRSFEDEDSRNLSEILPSEVYTPEHIAITKEREKNVKAILENIVEELGDPRLRDIIEWRLLADEPETLASLGERLNLSREGARLLEAKMLKMARDQLQTWNS